MPAATIVGDERVTENVFGVASCIYAEEVSNPLRSGGRQHADTGAGVTMKFGIFDHLDDSGLPTGKHFEDRFSLIEAYDRCGFYAYHLAEHHGTPLGMAPSPGVFLAAIAQRTKRLRFGPLVYLLPLYHPIRLIEEICMLDHMSNGRLELGVGRGVSPIEVGFYGVDPAEGPLRFAEALKVIRQGLTSDKLTFHGDYYSFSEVFPGGQTAVVQMVKDSEFHGGPCSRFCMQPAAAADLQPLQPHHLQLHVFMTLRQTRSRSHALRLQ